MREKSIRAIYLEVMHDRMNIIPAFVRRKIEHRPKLLAVIENVGWLFFDKFLRLGVGLVVGTWVARHLGPEQFGLLNFAIAFVSLFGAFVVLGLPSIVVRDIVKDPSKKEVTLGTAAVLQLVGGFFSYAFILSCIFWLRPDDALAKVAVAIIGGMMLFKAADVSIYWFESQVRSKYVVWVQNGVFLFFALIKIFLVLIDAGIVAFAWVALGESIAAAILLSLLLVKRPGGTLKTLEISWGRAKELLKDSWPLLFSSFAITAYMKIDQIMLAFMRGDEMAGIYSAALRLSEVLYFIPVAICASIFPSMLEAKERDEKFYYKCLQHLFDAMVWLSIFAAIFIALFSDWLINLLFGSEYSSAGPVLAIHIWGAVFVFLGVASSRWFVSENLQYLSLQRTLLGLLINILGNIFLIPSHGAVGAAISTVFSQAVAAWFSDVLQSRTRVLFFMKAKAFNPVSAVKVLREYFYGGR